MTSQTGKHHISLNTELHQKDQDYGSSKNASGIMVRLPLALRRMNEEGLCNSFLDYGTGKGRMIAWLKEELPEEIKLTGYDPAIKQYAKIPTQNSDIVTCLDVLEHVELMDIDSIIKEISGLTNNFCFLLIDIQPASKSLADGRNAHILLAPPDWWTTKISQHFSCITLFPIKHQTGLTQKIAISATNDPEKLPAMHRFLNKLNIYTMEVTGGILGNLLETKN